MLGVGLFLLFSFEFEPLGERFQTVVITDGVNSVYSLPQPFDTGQVKPLLVLGSDSVFADGTLLKRSDYLITPEAGQLILFVSQPELTEVRVIYRYLLFTRGDGKKKSFQLKMVGKDSEEAVAVSAEDDTVFSATADRWQISGNKSIGFSLGSNEGLGIDQATRIGFIGRVDDIEIEAELSDQSSPIPPEGITLNLEELDRILINVRGSGWQGGFGDIELGANAGSFGAISRRAMGGVVTGHWGFVSGSAGYAQPRGEFYRVRLNGIDGVQGPYLLAPDGRSAEIVPKSEAVYLNGRRMVRGWDADYTIDYSTGEIYFTNRNIITNLKRIEAEFQFVTFDYERAGVCAGIEIEPGPFELDLSFFQEGDNPLRMISDELTVEQKELLGALGKDVEDAWLPGGEFVGQGNGDYVLENGHYQFVGRGAGDYRVRFTLRGDSLGAYVYDDTLIGFRYVGSGAGNYVDSFKVALPKLDEIAYGKTGFSYKGLGGFFEAAFRRRNLNRFAPERVADDAGAFGVGFNWEYKNLGISLRHQGRHNNFALPGAITNIDFPYRWAGTRPEQVRLSDEVVVRVQPFKTVELQGELGRLTRWDDTIIDRLGGQLQSGWFSISGFDAGDFSAVNTEIAPRFFWFYPRAGWQQEVKGLELNRTLRVGGEVKPMEGLGVDLNLQLTRFQAKESATGIWHRTGNGQILQLGLYQDFREVLRLSGDAGFQGRSYTESGQDNWQKYFGTVSAAITPFPGLRFAIDLNQSNRLVQLRDEQFRYIGPGKGSYRQDSISGGYVYDPDGDYERVIVYSGRFAAAKDFILNGSISLTGFEPVQVLGSFSRNQTRADTGILSDNGSFNLGLSPYIFEPIIKPSVGASGSFSLDRTLRITGRRVSRNQEFVELASERIPGIELQTRINRADIIHRLASGAIGYEERGWLFSFMPVIGALLRLETGLNLEFKQIAEPQTYPELGRFNLNSIEGWLARNWVFGGRIRLRTSSGITYRWSRVNYLPYDVELTQPLGWVPQGALELEHLFSDIISLSSRYSFTDRTDKAAEHQFSLEMRAFF
ncbi:MAG: hypothetical protein ACUVUR_03655 [bacterium]